MTPLPESGGREYVAVVDQDDVTDEVRDIALKYDPLNRSGDEGFHVTADGELHIEDAKVMSAHRLIEKKIPNDAIRIVPLPAETGQLIHQYGENGFRLYDLPAPERGDVVGLLGRNGVGKTTALRILAGELTPNFGTDGRLNWAEAIESVRGTALQDHFERLRDGDVTAAVKPQRVDSMDHESETVAEYLSGSARAVADLVEAFDLEALQERRLAELSGGERQRVAVAGTLATDADLYVLDEPSSFLDVEQRLRIARAVREHVERSGAAALVVDHDLATLDLVADAIHVIYGESGGFGVVSGRLSARRAINEFLEGYLTEENIRIRPDAIEFRSAADRHLHQEDAVLDYPELGVGFDDFSLRIEPGQFHAGESIGVVGRNGLGKTTFARLIADELAADEGAVTNRPAVSYKPQYLSPDEAATVRSRFAAVTNVDSQAFRTRIGGPFDLEELLDRRLDGLSGGELQRVGIALCLARDADLYLLDEPSAFLDVERRASVTTALRRFGERTDRPVLVVDHDLFVIDRVADRVVVFDGEPGRRGVATSPQSKRAGMNEFLASAGVTFRRDDRTGRPRVNKPGSTLDRRQKADGEYYYSS